MRLKFSFAFALVLIAQTAHALHLIGGSLRYFYKNSDSTYFEMELFRDCGSSGAMLGPVQIGIYGNGVLFSTFEVPLGSLSQLDLSQQQCPGVPINVCVQRGLYTFSVLLPNNNFTYVVEYQRCCLSPAYSNVLTPSDVGMTLQVAIPPQARQWHNNSPVWQQAVPQFIACAHHPQDNIQSAVDPDGDQLNYFLCTPLAGGGPITNGPDLYSCDGVLPNPPCPPPFDLVPMNSPEYFGWAPLGQNSASVLDSQGVWHITPETIGQFYFSVCVQEFRDSVLLGVSQRILTLFVADGDVATHSPSEVSVLNCAPNPATWDLNISVKEFGGEPVLLTVRNAAGKTVFSKKTEGADDVSIPLESWSAGLYMIQAESGSRTAVGRFIKN